MMPSIESRLTYTYMEIVNRFQTHNRIICPKGKFLAALKQILLGFCLKITSLRTAEPQPQKV